MKLVRKKVLGYSLIPKINEMPPKIICDTEDFFKQLENLGFTLIDLEDQPSDKNESTVEQNLFIMDEVPNISIEGGLDLSMPENMIIKFIEEDKVEVKKEIDNKSENSKESKSNKKNNKKNNKVK